MVDSEAMCLYSQPSQARNPIRRGSPSYHSVFNCERNSQLRYECEPHSHLSYYIMVVKLIRILNYECVLGYGLYTLYTCIYVEMDKDGAFFTTAVLVNLTVVTQV